jgi:PII-like signaling protein
MRPRSASSSEKTTSTIAYPLYEAIVLKAREMNLAGATVLQGTMGYGHSTQLHTTKILRLAEDLPLLLRSWTPQENINKFLPVLDLMMTSGLVTVEKAQVLQHGTRMIPEPVRA